MEDQLVDVGNLILENNSAVDELGLGLLTVAGAKIHEYNKAKKKSKEAFELVDNDYFREHFDRPKLPESPSEKALYYVGRFFSAEHNGRRDALIERYEDIEIEEALANHAYAEGMDTEINYSSI